MSSAVLRSEWSVPPSGEPRRAIDHHVARYAAWLRRAGAEARFAIIFCAGKGAKRRLIDGLTAHGVDVVVAPSTTKRPLPKAVLEHEGDHYNDRLFLIDGFEGLDPEPLFDVLNMQKDQLKKTATWVGLCIESLAALRTLYGEAQGIVNLAERQVLVLAAGAPMEDPVPESLQKLWLANGAVAELVFADALTPDHPTTYDAFSRVVRAGYVADFLGTEVHPDRRALVELWANRSVSELDVDLNKVSPTVAAALLRHGEGLSEADRVILGGKLGGDPQSLIVGALPIRDFAYTALATVTQMGAGEVPVDQSVISALVQQIHAAPSPIFKVHGWLAIAAAQAADGDLEACVDAISAAEALAKSPVPLEVSFRVFEKVVQLATYRGARTEAQGALGHLAVLARALHSPFYDARDLLARAQFTEPLDPRRAAKDYQDAQTLFAGHGYPSWAAEAAEGLARCR